MPINYYKHTQPFVLENGSVIEELTIAYNTFGTINESKDNIIWVCHALTANSDVEDWWPNTVKKDRFLDPERYFVICANVLGSHYGTTGPLSINPKTAEPYFGDFPVFTIRDIVNVHQILAEALNIKKVSMLIGSSIGGFQCMEWAIMQPDFVEKLVLVATNCIAKPWAIAFNESQRMAIESDNTFGNRDNKAGLKGLKTARSIALLSYRGQIAYDKTQIDDKQCQKLNDYRASSYQKYQGEKLCNRFNAYSYYRLTQAFDSHNIARNRGCIEEALGLIRAKTIVISISSDILFPKSDHDIFHKYIKNVKYFVIDSDFGHDGFLIENEKLNKIIKQ